MEKSSCGFAPAVQYAAIYRGLTAGPPKWLTFRGLVQVAVGSALEIPEYTIPRDLTQACEELLDAIYASFNDGLTSEQDWLRPYFG